MKHLIFRSMVTLLAFSIGVVAASIWFVLRRPTLQPPPPEVSAQPPAPPVDAESSNPSTGEYFQANDEERRLGVRHYVRPRSEYSGIFGCLSEFIELKGKSKRNTFYVSKIERDDQCNESSNYVCSYVNVFWKEDNSILTLYPPFDKEDNTYHEWIYSMRRVDLAKDVVPTWKEVGTTNWLVPRTEANEMIRNCLASGIKLVIEKPK